jgi:uroporphyrinogen decarboxylase
MTKMTSRERVHAAFSHKEPDRMPMDLMGTASCLTDPAYFALLAHLGIKEKGRMFRKGENVNYYDTRILDVLQVDFRRVWMRSPVNWQPTTFEDGSMTDEWGMLRKKVGATSNFINAPLEDATISDLDAYPWPDPYDPGRTEGLAEEAKTLHEAGEYAISARSATQGIFELAMRMRGMEQFFADLLLDKPFSTALVHKIKEVQMGFYEVYLNAVGPYVDMVETGDDYGAQHGPLISPKVFAEIIAPARKELNQWIKSKAPNAKVFLHSDGSIFKLIPTLIETGVEVLNPIEPDATGNVPSDLKGTFGSELIFHGHLDTKGAMRGSKEDARSEARRVVDEMAPGGGYVMAPTNHLQTDVPPENILEMYRFAAEYSSKERS